MPETTARPRKHLRQRRLAFNMAQQKNRERDCVAENTCFVRLAARDFSSAPITEGTRERSAKFKPLGGLNDPAHGARRSCLFPLWFPLRHALVQQLLRTLQHPQPALRQILPGTVHIKRQHPHARRWPLRRNLLRSQASRNRRGILLEQALLGIGRFGIHARRPLPRAMRAAVRGVPCPRPAACRPRACDLLRRSSFRAGSVRLGRPCSGCPCLPRSCRHLSPSSPFRCVRELEVFHPRTLLQRSQLSSYPSGQRLAICNRLITYRSPPAAVGALPRATRRGQRHFSRTAIQGVGDPL